MVAIRSQTGKSWRNGCIGTTTPKGIVYFAKSTANPILSAEEKEIPVGIPRTKDRRLDPSSSKFSSRNERNGNTKDRYLRVSEVTAGRIHTLTSSNRRRRGRLECTASYTKKITNTSYIVQCTYPSFPFETRVSNFVSKILPLDSGDLVDILIFVNEIFLPRK